MCEQKEEGKAKNTLHLVENKPQGKQLGNNIALSFDQNETYLIVKNNEAL